MPRRSILDQVLLRFHRAMLIVGMFRNFPLILAIYLRLVRRGRGLVAILWNGTRYTLHPDLPELSRHLIQEAWADNAYSLPTHPRLGKHVVIDIGANMGSFALAAAHRYPNGVVYCFEPDLDNFALLNENIAANHLESRVKAWAKAVSDHDGKAVFYKSELSPTRHSLVRHELFQTSERRANEIETVSLASFFETQQVDRCDLLKVDCEGAEFSILLGTPDHVFDRVRAISLEYHDGVTEHSHEQLAGFLHAKGYHVETEPSSDNCEFGIIHARRPEAVN